MKTAVVLSALLLSMGFMFKSNSNPGMKYSNSAISLELKSDGTFSIVNKIFQGREDGLFYLSSDSTKLQLFPFFSVNDSGLIYEQKYSKKLKLENGYIKLVNESNGVLLYFFDSTWREVNNTILPKSNVKFFTSEFGFKDVIVNEGVNEIVIKKVSRVGLNKMRKILFRTPMLDKNQYCIYNKDSIVLTLNKKLYVLKRSKY